MIDFTLYNFITGMIVGTGVCTHVDYPMQANDEEHVRLGVKIDGQLWYMPQGKKTARPALNIPSVHEIAADGFDAVSFSLPSGSAIYARDSSESWLDESEFHMTTEQVGTFRFIIVPAAPYQGPIEVTIHAT